MYICVHCLVLTFKELHTYGHIKGNYIFVFVSTSVALNNFNFPSTLSRRFETPSAAGYADVLRDGDDDDDDDDA